MESLSDNKELAQVFHEGFPGIGYFVRDRQTFDFSTVARVG